MTATEPSLLDTSLHLPSLSIRRFRGIEALSFPRMGRVTLLTGKNAVGKTTVLEAVQVYAAQDRFPILRKILADREELPGQEVSDFIEVDWTVLFCGRNPLPTTSIAIGPLHSPDALNISITTIPGRQLSLLDDTASRDYQALLVKYYTHTQVIPFHIDRNASVHGSYALRRRLRAMEDFGDNGPPPGIESVGLGPGIPTTRELSRFWDSVLESGRESTAVDALRPILGNQVIDAVMTLGESTASRGSRVLVNLGNGEPRVPLKSLGDGVVRLFSLALALANSQGGFLLIDEAENGIHHSIQADYWRMVLRAAHEYDIQVLATTHSRDCVSGFATAAVENQDIDGVLFRIERDEGGTYATAYSEKELKIAAEHGIEVR